MVNCVGAEDLFFDSLDHHLSPEHDTSGNGVFGYDFWMNEPKSIKERRSSFLREMGFIDSCSSFERNNDLGDVYDDDDDGMERMMERSSDISSSCSSSSTDNEVFYERECNVDVNVYDEDHQIRQSMGKNEDDNPSTSSNNNNNNGDKSINKKIRHWWKEMMKKQKRGYKSKEDEEKTKKFEINRMKVKVNEKKLKELSALFEVQEIEAHKGMIWTMKFSPDGQYLATAGEDGVVRVWRVNSVDSSIEKFPEESTDSPKKDENTVKVPVVIPDKMFNIQEFPVQEFHGHTADVLDLAWSESNFLLSSSMDKTVRLWKIGSNTCLSTFHHTDYVTCVQFNPINNQYFISGSIDGKVRIWGVSNQRVLDWVDIRDAVTAVCYQPDAQAFHMGTLNGSCYFYETKGEFFELNAHLLLGSKKRSCTNRITGIQFHPEDFSKVMVMTEDSKLRILEKTEVVSKFRGLPKSGSQTSASFASNRKHIISIGQDSRVYLWNHEEQIQSSSRRLKSNRSCEHFSSKGVSVALPWSSSETTPKVSSNSDTIVRPSKLFSSKRAATWPEHLLPTFSQSKNPCPTWGLVIVTANFDGKIRTYHNYGLPVRA
ncbi:uncharacterized WD repeat-containing protein C3H5.08c-like isoform X2 [Amaranthus tricolor]|nr:uncharacterized WD repeat-containing protein C3H5.08c-like isoform X2 [Amaranthus tricolor]